MEFVNLTGHTIRLYLKEQDSYIVSRCFPSHRDATEVVRCNDEIRWLDGIPIINHSWTKLNDFPERTKDVFYIVSESAARAARNILRMRGIYDLLIPISPIAAKHTHNLNTLNAKDVIELPCTTFDWFVEPEVPEGFHVVGYSALTWLENKDCHNALSDSVSPEHIKTRSATALHEEFHVLQQRCRKIGKELLIGSDYALLFDSPKSNSEEAPAVSLFSGLSAETVKCYNYTDASLSDLVEYIESCESAGD